MSDKPIIKIRIDARGECHLEVCGVTGTSCEELTRPILEALGGDTRDVQHKPNYYVELDAIEQYVTEDE